MSIQSEINRIVSARDSSFTAVAEKGVTVPSGSTIDDLPGLIEEIQGTPSLQSKSIEPLESIQIVTADSAYDGLSSVTVGAISSTYVGSGIPTRTAANLSASGSIVTVPSGYYVTGVAKAVDSGSITIGSQTVGDSYLEIGFDTRFGLFTAWMYATIPVAATVETGYITACEPGSVKISADTLFQIPSRTAATYIPTTTDQTIPSYYYLKGPQTIVGDSNLIPQNIAADVSIFGVVGTHQGGTSIDDIIIIGDYGLCFNNFSVSSNTCISEAGTVSGNTLIAV